MILGRFRLDIRKSFYSKGGEALAQAAYRGGGCPIPGNTQGQAGWGLEPLMELHVSLNVPSKDLGHNMTHHFQTMS